MDYQLHHQILKWIEEAAMLLRQSLTQSIAISQKTNASDLVTEMDQAIERFFIERISTHYPEHCIIGEEGMTKRALDTKGIVWVIDPIDGTLNFVKQKDKFGIMIGIFKDGKPIAGYIYDVMAYEVYFGIVGEGVYCNYRKLKEIPINSVKNSLVIGNSAMFVLNLNQSQRLLKHTLGSRTHGSAALELIDVINGKAAVYVSAGLNPWDFAAGWAICESFGWSAMQLDGQPLSILEKSSVVFGQTHLCKEVVKILSEDMELGDINEYA